MNTPFDFILPSIPSHKVTRVEWTSLWGSARSLAIAQMASRDKGFVVVLTPDVLTAELLNQELQFFVQSENTTILNFPDRETLPYDCFSPHRDIISERLKILSQLSTLDRGILIVPVTTAMHFLSPRTFVTQHSLVLSCGQEIDLTRLKENLQEQGYSCVQQVFQHGEFAVRGSILDVYPMGSAQPYRIDFLEMTIDSIHLFAPETQRSIRRVDHITVLPAHEFLFNDETIRLFRDQWTSFFDVNVRYCSFYQSILSKQITSGIEYYLPLFFEKLSSFFEYFPKSSLIVQCPGVVETALRFWQEIQFRYEQLSHDIIHPILPPDSLFLPPEDFFRRAKNWSQIKLCEPDSQRDTTGLSIDPLPDLAVRDHTNTPLKACQVFLQDNKDLKILFCVESISRREALQELLQTIVVSPIVLNTWNDFLSSSDRIHIIVAPLVQGFLCKGHYALITETHLFGETVRPRRIKQDVIKNPESVIRNLTELHLDDPIVHIKHGVGRFRGLQTLCIDEQVEEYLVLEYVGGDKLYVPVSSLHLISRYGGSDLETAPWHQLGSAQWEKAKQKALRRVRDAAAELLEIYARRALKKRSPYQINEQDNLKFAAAFPFEETQDQRQAIIQVQQDLCSERSMDRLICGDVGFGKTEIAMRAAFWAIREGKQVAVLAPTTILAQQHYETFKERFLGWPIRIALFSRLLTAKEQKQLLAELKCGEIQLVIGTHKLLSPGIQFQNLGLLVIDEEHRFGVRQKEKIKSLYHDIDLLTLTATPIPRTLHMSLAGVRDISIISTPPARRLSIKTFVCEYQLSLIREAILREISRGGQVYYLHNRVETIKDIAQMLSEYIPEARIAIAHGQMKGRLLKKTMSDFYHRRFNVLICSTIIESGLDIPTANTMIIERADKFGLAQLHQLRGRVGRSHHQAYAYFLTPREQKITQDSTQRLEAIAKTDDLGAGFILATHDLEIRGTGEILGEEQSGHMQEIGFELYADLLKRAIKALKRGDDFDLDRSFKLENLTEVDLPIPTLIPEHYLSDVQMRLVLYKRIANAPDHKRLQEIQTEMRDRFGTLPEAAQHLLSLAELKLKANALGIYKIEMHSHYCKILFLESHQVDPQKIIHLVQSNPKQYQFIGSHAFRFKSIAQTPAELLVCLFEVLSLLE